MIRSNTKNLQVYFFLLSFVSLLVLFVYFSVELFFPSLGEGRESVANQYFRRVVSYSSLAFFFCCCVLISWYKVRHSGFVGINRLTLVVISHPAHPEHP